jgi:hypothetical protein
MLRRGWRPSREVNTNSAARAQTFRLRRTAITRDATFDISVNDSALCILDTDGNPVEETKVASEADAVAQALHQQRAEVGLISAWTPARCRSTCSTA